MSKLIVMIVMLAGLSACHASLGIGDNGRAPNNVATDAFGSAVAQAAIGITDISY